MNRMILFLVFNLIFVSCENMGDKKKGFTGIIYGSSPVPTDKAYANFKYAINENEHIRIMAELDHAENAGALGLELEPTKIIFFGNPHLGTPLMQHNQLTALDLPQRVLFYEENERGFAAYNSMPYLESRYGLKGLESLAQISTAMENLVSMAIQHPVSESAEQTVGAHEGIVNVESLYGFEETYGNLKNLIFKNKELILVAEIDHQANAERIGLELLPTTVIIFGNPAIGSPLMVENRSIGLDLPQKILVWQAIDGTVNISYNDPEFIQKRHQLSESGAVIQQIKTALKNLAEAAAGK